MFDTFLTTVFCLTPKHDYPAALPLAHCIAIPVITTVAALEALPLFDKPTVTVPEVTEETYAVR